MAAAFWLGWLSTADAAAFPSGHLDHWGRKLESGKADPAADIRWLVRW